MRSDHDARMAALDPTKSCIVQAPAGSGKTALLVYRILRALATAKKPEQVLAITFTRKATAEMRQRLIGLLEKAEAGEKIDDQFQQQGIDLATEVLRRDRELGWHLLDAPEQLQLHTIDAFCARLSGDMPWLSRMGDKPGITDDATHLYTAAVESLFESLLETKNPEVKEALKTVLLELDFDYRRAKKLLVAMLAKRDQWLRHLVQNDLAELRDYLATTWQEILDGVITELTLQFPAPVLQSLINQANAAATHIPAGKPQLGAFKRLPITELSELSVAHWRDLQLLLTTAKAQKIRATVNVNLGFPHDHKERKQAMCELLVSLGDNSALLALFQELDALPEPIYSDADWQQLIALKKVLLRLAALLQLEFRVAGECDHSEVMQRALRALTDLDSPTDLGLRIDYQIHHILVDEFQDTSRSQIELLRRLTAGWELGDGRSLFLVGDPMQSIYRFREADVSLFLQVTDNANTGIFDNLDIRSLQLSENFRSSSTLVSWFNSTFEASFPHQGNVLSGAITYAPSTSNRSEFGVIRTELLHSQSQEADRVVDHVQRALQRNDTDKVAVLVRSRTHLNHIIKALDEKQVAYTGVDIKLLAEVAAIQDLLTLCKAISRPDDRLVWLSLLRSPLLGLTLNELSTLGSGNIWSALQRHSFSDATSVRVRRFQTIMEAAVGQRQQVPLFSLTDWAWQALGGYELQSDVSNEDIQCVLNIIASYEVGGDLPSLAALDEALAGLYAQPSSQTGERVVLSTIHKAKGLQYGTVILPGLDHKARSDDKNVLMWAERSNTAGAAQLLLAPIRLHQEAGQHFDYLRRLETERARQEMVRLLYVGCTRAEQEIVLLAKHASNKDGEIRQPVSTSLLSTVWKTLQDSFDIIGVPEEAQVDESPILDQSLVRLPADFSPDFGRTIDWQAQVAVVSKNSEVEQLEYQWATELATGVGLVLHSWLEANSKDVFTVNIDEHQKRQWVAELQALRVPPQRLAAGLKRLQKAIEKMQIDPHAKFLFANHHDEQNELALTRFSNGQLSSYKIDRTFVDSHNTRWIVDYKTTTTERADVAAFVDEQIAERHRPQLDNYGQLMRELDSRPIKLAVYFPLLGELRSWLHEPENP